MIRSILGPYLLSVALIATFGCGDSHQLKTVVLTAASANALGGQVQFTAMGIFSSSSKPVLLTSNDITWCVGTNTGVCPGNINTGATVNQQGLAQCNSGFAGTVTILAGKAKAPANPDSSFQLTVFGSSTLTCP